MIGLIIELSTSLSLPLMFQGSEEGFVPGDCRTEEGCGGDAAQHVEAEGAAARNRTDVATEEQHVLEGEWRESGHL